MRSLFQLFLDIALWRRGPRDVPAAGTMYLFVAAVYFLVGTVEAAVVRGWPTAFFLSAADLALVLVVLFVPLLATRLTHRFLQAATAVLGAGIVVALPRVALLFVVEQLGARHPLAFLVWLAALALIAWYLAIVANVVRLSTERPLAIGVLAALAYFVSSILLMAPPAAAPGGP